MEARVVAILKVTSVATSLGWYRSIGFEVSGASPIDDVRWAEVRHGPLVLQLTSGETPWPSAPTFTGCFYVHTSSVDDVFERIPETVRPEWGVEERPWGAVELTLQDPDGYYLTFTQDLDV